MKLKLLKFFVVSALSGGICLMPAMAAEELSKADKAFLQDAAESGIAEVELGRLAKKKAASPEVKMLGEHLVKDHEKANTELMALAKSKGVEIKAEPNAAQKKTIAAFEKQEGAAFDKEFQAQAVKDHKKSVALFEKAAKSATDTEIKAWAEKTLPVLKQHLAMAEKEKPAGEKGAKSGKDEKGAKHE